MTDVTIKSVPKTTPAKIQSEQPTNRTEHCARLEKGDGGELAVILRF